MTSAPTLSSWNDVLSRHLSPAQIARLGSCVVGIAGAGGLGSNCAMMLVRSGIRHFRIADHDVLEPSNLNRQFYFPAQLGKPKVEALGENLRALNPALDLTLRQELLTADSARAFFSGCDYVVEAVDGAATKQMLIETLLADGHTVIAASGMGGWGGDMTRRQLGRLHIVGDFSAAVSDEVPPMAPRVMMAAALEADEILRLILDAPAN